MAAAPVDDGLAGRMGRQKKSPEELANEALGEDEDESKLLRSGHKSRFGVKTPTSTWLASLCCCLI